MNLALAKLNPPPQHVLVDGLRVKTLAFPQTPIVSGDTLSYSIAAASILAKVTRDRLMVEFDRAVSRLRFFRPQRLRDRGASGGPQRARPLSDPSPLLRSAPRRRGRIFSPNDLAGASAVMARQQTVALASAARRAEGARGQKAVAKGRPEIRRRQFPFPARRGGPDLPGRRLSPVYSLCQKYIPGLPVLILARNETEVGNQLCSVQHDRAIRWRLNLSSDGGHRSLLQKKRPESVPATKEAAVVYSTPVSLIMNQVRYA